MLASSVMLFKWLPLCLLIGSYVCDSCTMPSDWLLILLLVSQFFCCSFSLLLNFSRCCNMISLTPVRTLWLQLYLLVFHNKLKERRCLSNESFLTMACYWPTVASTSFGLIFTWQHGYCSTLEYNSVNAKQLHRSFKFNFRFSEKNTCSKSQDQNLCRWS